MLSKGGRLREGGIRGGRLVNRVLDGIDGNYMADHDGNNNIIQAVSVGMINYKNVSLG